MNMQIIGWKTYVLDSVDAYVLNSVGSMFKSFGWVAADI